MSIQPWHWDQRHRDLQASFDTSTQDLSPVWGLEQAFALAATHTLNAPGCIDFMKFLPHRLKVRAIGDFDAAQPVVWDSSHEWTDVDKQVKLHLKVRALCRGSLVADYELEYCQRAPRSKPQPVSERTFAEQRQVKWPKATEHYEQFLQLLSWQDPIFLDDEFAQAMGFPKRILSDFFVFAALWFEGRQMVARANTLEVVCTQPAMATVPLNLRWNKTDQGIEGRLLDGLERPVFASFQLCQMRGV